MKVRQITTKPDGNVLLAQGLTFNECLDVAKKAARQGAIPLLWILTENEEKIVSYEALGWD